MNTPWHKNMHRPGRQRGAILVMYVFMLMLILAFAGIALDLGFAYFRKAQLQAVADSAAVAAARPLNGTAAGLAAAADAARTTAEGSIFGVDNAAKWKPEALSFAATPDAPAAEWKSAGNATASTALYARVDLSVLDAQLRMVEPLFTRILGVAEAIDIAPVAVAGPTALQVTPLAVCALSTAPAASRAAGAIQERVTYGFRQGVTYNLLKLNPQPGATMGAYFLVDPLAPAGPDTVGTAGMGSDGGASDVVGPFMCAGKIARVNTGGRLRVRRLASFDMAAHINSRLNIYTGGKCVRAGGAPDMNVKTYDGASNAWQTVKPAAASAEMVQGPGLPMSTIADQPPAPGQDVTAADYGILWAFGPAVSASGSSLNRTDWPTLYHTDVRTSLSGAYPYRRNDAGYTITPAQQAFAPARRDRRLMRIPLLNCGAGMPGTEATVLAYGRFFLPAAASADEVPGEFAGVDIEAALKTDVEIFQ